MNKIDSNCGTCERRRRRKKWGKYNSILTVQMATIVNFPGFPIIMHRTVEKDNEKMNKGGTIERGRANNMRGKINIKS